MNVTFSKISGQLDRWAKFVNGLEIEIRSLITKLHKTLSIGAKVYTKGTYTKLFQEIFCKTVEFIDFFDFPIKLFYS